MQRQHSSEARPCASPLAEGRELKCDGGVRNLCRAESPLAEGRELKYGQKSRDRFRESRPSRRGTN